MKFYLLQRTLTSKTKVLLTEEVEEESLQVDRAWEFLFESKTSLKGDLGIYRFANRFWDELGSKAGNLNRGSKEMVTATIPVLVSDALEFGVRLASFWADFVQMKKDETAAKNLWHKPVVDLLNDQRRGRSRANVYANRLAKKDTPPLNTAPIIHSYLSEIHFHPSTEERL